jgi:hypothetical protein
MAVQKEGSCRMCHQETFSWHGFHIKLYRRGVRKSENYNPLLDIKRIKGTVNCNISLFTLLTFIFFPFSSSRENVPSQVEESSDGDTDDEESLDSDDLSS